MKQSAKAAWLIAVALGSTAVRGGG